MNTFVRKYHGGLVSTEKEETQELWTSPMKLEYISKSMNCSGSYCYFVRTVILTLHGIQHGKKHPTVLDRRSALISTLHSVTSTHPGNLANKRLSIDSKTQHQQESLADHGSNKSTSI